MKLVTTPTAIPLGVKDLKKYEAIKAVLEAERTLYPSDYDAVALLVLNIGLMQEALREIKTNGSILQSTTAYGSVMKSNPANEVFAKANTAVKGLMEQLLMTPKSKATVMGAAEEKIDTNDPLTAALLNRRAP